MQEGPLKKKYSTRKSTLVLLLTICLYLGGCAITPPKLPPLDNVHTTQDLDKYLNALVENGEPPGLSVVVVKGDNIVYQRSFGMADGPRGIPASPDTVYQWWSLTKIYTAVAILQLVETGQLDLLDPVDQHLSFFKVNYPGETNVPITIRNLLSHSSGLSDIGLEILGWIHFDGDTPLSQTELLKLKLPGYKDLTYEPGSEGRYTNLGYMVLAAIIEHVSGQSYEGYIKEHILLPLGMNDTGFEYSEDMQTNAATGSHPIDLMSLIAFHYIDKTRAIREKTHGRYWFNNIYSDQQGSTGLIGSSNDMASFIVALLNNGSGNGKEILSPRMMELMAKPIVPVAESPAAISDNQKFGLGWFYLSEAGRVSLSHGGAGAAFVDLLRIYPNESLGIAIMANSTYLGRSMGSEIVDAIADLDWD